MSSNDGSADDTPTMTTNNNDEQPATKATLSSLSKHNNSEHPLDRSRHVSQHDPAANKNNNDSNHSYDEDDQEEMEDSFAMDDERADQSREDILNDSNSGNGDTNTKKEK